MLSNNDDIYWCEFNKFEEQMTPNRLKINENKFFDSLFITVSLDNLYYVWGKCGSNLTEVLSQLNLNLLMKFLSIIFQIL
jgi:hypothetical protein